MFTGLVEAMVKLVQAIPQGDSVRLVFDLEPFSGTITLGDSVAFNGCCLTAIEIRENLVAFEAGSETLRRTNLGKLLPGNFANAERALQFGDRLGGHLVSGHIDGNGKVTSRNDEGPWSTIRISAGKSILRQIASKGSVAIDGVSLTVVDATDEEFSIALIPHTLSVTTLGRLNAGTEVNIETDLLSKYVDRQLNASGCLRSAE